MRWRIGITGGTGYLGSVLTLRLLEEGFPLERVDLLARRPPPPLVQARLAPSRVHYKKVDVSRADEVKSLPFDYHCLIHLAGMVGYPACDRDPDHAELWNVQATRNVLEWGKAETRLLLASTTSSYGEQPAKAEVDERTPAVPMTMYSRTKLAAEKLVLSRPQNIVFRFTTGFGLSPAMRDDLLIHDFVGKAVSGEPLAVYEDSFVRQFIHVRDMAEAVIFALQRWDAMKGQTFNVGNPEIELTKRQLVEAIAELHPFPYRLSAPGNDLEKRNYRVSFRKLLSLGFKPAFGLREGLAEILDHYRDMRGKEKANAG